MKLFRILIFLILSSFTFFIHSNDHQIIILSPCEKLKFMKSKALVKENSDWAKRWVYLSSKPIGSGDYGKVYETVDLDDGNLCALKIQDVDDDFINEAYAYVMLSQKGFKHMPVVYEIWTDKGKGYIAMEKLSSYFGDWTFKDGQIEGFMKKLNLILDKLEGLGFTHGDSHEGNVMCDSNGFIKLIDFGQAAEISEKTPEKEKSFFSYVRKSQLARLEQTMINGGVDPQNSSSDEESETNLESGGKRKILRKGT